MPRAWWELRPDGLAAPYGRNADRAFNPDHLADWRLDIIIGGDLTQ